MEGEVRYWHKCFWLENSPDCTGHSWFWCNLDQSSDGKLYTCTFIFCTLVQTQTVHLYYDIFNTRAHQGWPWPALAYFGCPGPGLYPGQPWFTLAAGGQSNQIQGIRGVIYLTRADQGWPWPALAYFGCPGAVFRLYTCTVITVHLYWDRLLTCTVIY